MNVYVYADREKKLKDGLVVRFFNDGGEEEVTIGNDEGEYNFTKSELRELILVLIQFYNYFVGGIGDD